MNPDWQALMDGGFDRLADALEDDAVPAGADAVAVVVFGHGEVWVRLGGAWDADVVGMAVTALIGGMEADALAEGNAAAVPLVERFDA